MALWGKNDNVGSGGLVSLNYSTRVVTGSGTTFGQVGAAKTGDVIRFGVRGGTYFGDAVIVGIASTTQLTIDSTAGLSGASIASTDFYVSELPKYTVLDSSYSELNGAGSSIVILKTGAASTAAVGVATIYLDSVYGLKVNDIMTSGSNVRIVSSIGATSVSLASTIASQISSGAAVTFTRNIGAYDKQVYGITTTTGYGSVSTAYRTDSAGWVGVTTYVDTQGNLRVKSEILVAMSGITTGTNGILYPTNK